MSLAPGPGSRFRSLQRGSLRPRSEGRSFGASGPAPAAARLRAGQAPEPGADLPSSRSYGFLRRRSGARPGGPAVVQNAEEHRNEEEGRRRREKETSDHGPAERGVLLAAFPQTESHRNHSNDHRERGHDDRPKPGEPGGRRG